MTYTLWIRDKIRNYSIKLKDYELDEKNYDLIRIPRDLQILKAIYSLEEIALITETQEPYFHFYRQSDGNYVFDVCETLDESQRQIHLA